MLFRHSTAITIRESTSEQMKRIKIIVPIALLLLLAVALLCLPRADSNAPKFVPATSQPAGPFGKESYDWGADIPFQGGKIWIWTALSRTNHHFFLYDLDKGIVLGELSNAGVALVNQDQTRLLCEGFPSPIIAFKDKVVGFLNRNSPWKIATNNVEHYWILDLQGKSARRVGELSQRPGIGTRWQRSPGFRYGFKVPTADLNSAFLLCDLETGKFEQIKFKGWLEGWWDDHRILISDVGGNYVLFDVVTRKTSTLFSAETFARNLKELGISDDPTNLSTIFNWNGRDFDLYFTGKRDWNIYTNGSFLVKADRAGGCGSKLGSDSF